MQSFWSRGDKILTRLFVSSGGLSFVLPCCQHSSSWSRCQSALWLVWQRHGQCNTSLISLPWATFCCTFLSGSSLTTSCFALSWWVSLHFCSLYSQTCSNGHLQLTPSEGSLLLKFWLGRFVPSAELMAVILCSPLWGGGKGQKRICRCFKGENQGSAQDVYNRSPEQFSLEAIGLLGNL